MTYIPPTQQLLVLISRNVLACNPVPGADVPRISSAKCKVTSWRRKTSKCNQMSGLSNNLVCYIIALQSFQRSSFKKSFPIPIIPILTLKAKKLHLPGKSNSQLPKVDSLQCAQPQLLRLLALDLCRPWNHRSCWSCRRSCCRSCRRSGYL